MVNGWKVTAIIFIILFVAETIGFVLITKIGINMIENEETCIVDICADDEYDAYSYDDWTKECSCYTDNELKHTEYID